jgi:hypothetical protein
MSFDNKQYPNRKDHRSNYEYNTAERVSRSCRSHGGDPICEGNRMFKEIRNKLIAKYELADLGKDGDLSGDVRGIANEGWDGREGIGGA